MFGIKNVNSQWLKSFLPEAGLVVLLLVSLLYLWQAQSGYQVAQAAESQNIGAIDFFTRFNKTPANYQVVDIRSRELFEKGPIPVALSVPAEQFSDPEVVAQLDHWKTTIIISEDGAESAFASAGPYFKNAYNLQDGMRAWRIRGLLSVPGPPGATTTLA